MMCDVSFCDQSLLSKISIFNREQLDKDLEYTLPYLLFIALI